MSTEMVALNLGAGQYAQAIEEACIKFGIITPLQKAHFLAQIGHESGGFRVVRESLNYSVDGLMKTFGRHRISAEDCQKYGRTAGRAANQTAIANLVYGGEWGRKNLGNTQPGDGSRFIGRGLKQLTGRANYYAYSMAMYGDDRIVQNPVLLERAPDVAWSAGWFWQRNNLNAFADRDDIEGLTRRVNGGLNGIEDRKLRLAEAKAEFAKQVK